VYSDQDLSSSIIVIWLLSHSHPNALSKLNPFSLPVTNTHATSNRQVSRSIIFLLSGSISLFRSAQAQTLETVDEHEMNGKPKDDNKQKLLVTLLPGKWA